MPEGARRLPSVCLRVPGHSGHRLGAGRPGCSPRPGDAEQRDDIRPVLLGRLCLAYNAGQQPFRHAEPEAARHRRRLLARCSGAQWRYHRCPGGIVGTARSEEKGRETSMRTSVVSLIAAAAAVGIVAIGIRPVLTAPNPTTPNPEVRPADADPQPFNPQMGALMNMIVQPRHAKLGLAGQAENWALATYYFKELKTGFGVVSRASPRSPMPSSRRRATTATPRPTIHSS